MLFFIQDADQRFRNELSGMVQFVPRIWRMGVSATQTQRLEDPTSVSDPYFRASDGDGQWIAEVVE